MARRQTQPTSKDTPESAGDQTKNVEVACQAPASLSVEYVATTSAHPQSTNLRVLGLAVLPLYQKCNPIMTAHPATQMPDQSQNMMPICSPPTYLQSADALRNG